MNRIREKATESEAIVRAITKDIQVLDLAKRNISLSMTTLKRFQMLGTDNPPANIKLLLTNNCIVNAIGQLEAQIQQKNYSEIAQTLLVRPHAIDRFLRLS